MNDLSSLSIDVLNLSFLYGFLIVIFFVFKIKMSLIEHLIILFSLALPFFLNDVLFSVSYHPDQTMYLAAAQNLRSSLEFDPFSSVGLGGGLLGLIPIPYIDSVRSLSLANRFLMILFILYLIHKKYVFGHSRLFILLYPSVLLYSSMGLRDGLIIILMVAGALSFLNKNFLIGILILIPLSILKIQNLVVILPFCFFHYMVGKRISYFGHILFFASALLISSGVLLFRTEIFEVMNLVRIAMWTDNGGDISEIQELVTWGELVSQIIPSLLNFFFTPKLGQITNSFQAIQSLENMVIFIFGGFFIHHLWSFNKRKTIFWISFLFAFAVMYGLTVANAGTLSRYKHVGILVFVVLAFYDIFGKKIGGEPRVNR